MEFKVLQTWNFVYCADTVEWCPITPYQHYFICGTYELQHSDNKSTENSKNDQFRIGQLHLFSITEKLKLFLHDTIDTSGILDIKWCPKIQNEKILLATANADGKVRIWNFITENYAMPSVAVISEFKINDGILLSVDWSSCNYNMNICVSDSSGYVTIFYFEETYKLVLLHKLKIHKYETWIASFDFWNNSLLYTGGDDCLLKITDLIAGKEVAHQKEHQSGVTSIRFNHLNPYMFISGSYDETIKLWDTRKIKHSLLTTQVGGGIWRIKWDPHMAENILTASMYSGFHWFKYSKVNKVFELRSQLKEHGSIGYGADICHLSSDEIRKTYFTSENNPLNSYQSPMLTVTCSFYDKKLCLCIL